MLAYQIHDFHHIIALYMELNIHISFYNIMVEMETSKRAFKPLFIFYLIPIFTLLLYQS